ncbi:hypothetical protein MJ524_26275 [Escherichia coli]|nr:hypothetical protein MJ524_26275 [Escherichia coli]
MLLAGVLFLFAAVAAVPRWHRGWVLALCWDICWQGLQIGPWGLGFISDVDEILHFSELGVVFPDVYHRHWS